MKHWRLACVGLVLVLPLRAEGGLWEQEVRPLLVRNCFRCHGPDQSKRKADLRLDRPGDLRAARDEGPLIRPGKPEESLLWRRVASDDPDLRMPPSPDHEPLSKSQLDSIRRWIVSGAELGGHWSHEPIRRPVLPAATSAWPRNPIDLLLHQQLRQRGAAEPKIASRSRLARRLALTLTGLPPSPAAARLLTDNSPRDVARYVDHLLASPAYGEHMASAWLDLARYADTHGYHIDGRRDMWRWRDWVIQSLNENLPFDQFTIHQVAGDLLPGAGLRHRLATGLFRNNMINSEDGAIAEEFLAEYAAERTIALGVIWLGQTLQCCRCHDHKNDPLLQRDFYQLAAFFNDVPELGVDGRKGNAAPTMAAPTREQLRRWGQLRKSGMALDKQLDALLARPRDAAQQAWERRVKAAGPRPAPPASAELPLNDGGGRRAVAADNGPAARIEGLFDWSASRQRVAVLLSSRGRIHWDLPPLDEFTIGCWVFPTTGDPMTLMALGEPALQLTLDREGRFQLSEGEQVLATAPKPSGAKQRKWQHLAWSFRGGLHTVLLNGSPVLTWRETPDPDVRTGEERGRAEIKLPVWIGGPAGKSLEGGLRGMVDQVHAYDKALSTDDVLRLAGADPLMDALAIDSEMRSPAMRRLLRCAFLLDGDEPFIKLHAARQRTRQQLGRLKSEFPTTMVMQSGAARPTFVLERGDYQRPLQRVERSVPSWLPPLDTPAPTRLDLARWLVSSDHPLTARVVANRVWQAHFGVGLAPTADDLGLGGTAPEQTELLDLLASELIASGWDMKHMHRLVVTSATFLQQSPRLPGAPAFARQLPAEVLRDSALAAGGVLVRDVGGPSVFPYQPAGLWEELARDPNLYSAQVYREDQSAGLYRRSVYTFWKRSSPPPTLQLLGAPSRETCVVQRQPAAGAQQALVLLNDPTFVEAARLLAQRIVKRDASQQIAWGFKQVLVRAPSDREARRLAVLLESLRRHYQDDQEAARSLLQVGRSPAAASPPVELAAWAAWCNTLMNTDEFQTLP